MTTLGRSAAVTKAVRAARFVGGIYGQRAMALYAAHVRGDLLTKLSLPGGREDAYEIYERLRARGELVPTRLGNYSTTSYRLCKEVLRSRSFGVTPLDGSIDAAHQNLDLSLLTLNPPDHTRIRRLAAPAFTPRRMAAYVPLVDTAIHRLMDGGHREGPFDLMTDFASPLPIAVMTHLLGLPDEPARFRRLGSTIAGALDGIWSLSQARRLAGADAELRATFDDLLQRRRTDPGDDLVSALVAAEQEESLDAVELAGLVRLILLAGFETTVNAIGNGLRWLLADRTQWEALVADPSLAPRVAEEVLRYDPPVQQTARVAQAPVTLGDRQLATGQWVITLLAAANRDPQVYPDPHRFDITREPDAEHLAFSGGIHYCLGSPLARMELAQAFRALAERWPTLRPAGEITMRPGTTLRGPLRFPVTLA